MTRASIPLVILSLLPLPLAACGPGHPEARSARTIAVETTMVAPGCAGTEIDLDRLGDTCRYTGGTQGPPGRALVAMRLSPETLTLPSGGEGAVTLSIVNRGERPLTLEFHDGCLAFDYEILDEKGGRADRQVHCVQGGLCAQGRPQRVELSPGGVLKRAVQVAARRVVENAMCQTTTGKLPPGRYTLRVRGPFEDRDPRNSSSVVGRTVDGALVVTP